MKKILYVILLFNGLTLLGQVREELNYYPLHVGDVWQYKIQYLSAYHYETTTFYMTKIVKSDTVILNKKYFVVEQPPFTYQKFTLKEVAFLRIDTLSGNVIRYFPNKTEERKIDSLYCKLNDRISFYFTYCIMHINKVEKKQFFSESFLTKTYVSSPTTNGQMLIWELANGLGVIRQGFHDAPVTAIGNSYSLVYAKINGKEYGTYVSVEDVEAIPSEFSLSQNFPNPFNPETTIEYSIPKAEFVTLKVFDVLGKEVATLVNEFKQTGVYSSKFNALRSSLPSGIYFYGLKAGNYSKTNKMILLK